MTAILLMAALLSLPSFAKVNWILKILGKRSDGFHEILTLYQTVDLKDGLELQVLDQPVIQLEVNGRSPGPVRENLVLRAASLLREHVSGTKGVFIRLKKRVPMSAGLGGGSSNAAVTLMALNQLWEAGLSLSQLAELGGRLGSDVPFFLWGGSALGEGRGEIITPLPDNAERELLLVHPGMSISTSEAYGLEMWGSWTPEAVLTSRGAASKMQNFREAVENFKCSPALLENDFETPLFKKYPLLQRVRQILAEAGCEKILLCGSGSTLLAISSAEGRLRAAEAVERNDLGRVFHCRTLGRNAYRREFKRSGLKFPE
ncbi:MAG: 4-(cytidine 5'-diphospho)-2-C-methyl-D-erythritol kinase [Acidobacteria bacterium]|nr:4-(cytidine 5'-diphospho)-2-C-methyl-D-erythritol kinase [Acidobacteriota bacterium]